MYFGLRQNQAHQDYRNPIIGFYDFDKNQIFTLDIHYPEFYTSNDDIGIYGFPSITYYNENIFITYPYSPETYIYDFNGILLGQIESPSKFKTGQPPEPGEDKRMHGKNNPFYSGIIPLDQGKYFIQSGRHRIPEDPENESFGFTIIYNQEFTNFITFDKNDLPLSFDGDYFYYPIPPEQSEYQLMERYRIEME